VSSTLPLSSYLMLSLLAVILSRPLSRS
jgi:hypothetical protein